jgi:hypothetical protein
MPYYLAGAVYALTFVGFYLYFARVETARAAVAESVSA